MRLPTLGRLHLACTFSLATLAPGAALLGPPVRCRRLTMQQVGPAAAAAAAAANPRDPVVHYQLGIAQLQAGSAAAAAASLRRSLELGWLEQAWHDDPLGPYHAAADELMEAREYAAAEECWRHSLQLDAGNVAIHERLAATLRLSGKLTAAADALHDTLVLLGNEGDDEEDTGVVVGVAGGAEEEAEVQCWLWMDLGSVIEDVVPIAGTGAAWPSPGGEPSPSPPPSVRVGSLAPESLTAEACYRRALALGPEVGEAHKRLADVLACAEGPAAAQPHFARAARLLPDDICCATHVHYAAPSPAGRRLPAPPLPPPAAEGDAAAAAAPTLRALQVEATGDEWVRRAASVFEAHGVVVLPSLLGEEARAALQAAVVAAEDSAADFTAETREAAARAHRALPVGGAARAALGGVAAELWPLLGAVLQAEAAPLLGAGFMRVGPGAEAQQLHKDVHGHDRHGAVEGMGGGGPGGAARAVSIQLQLTDTTAQPHMGALEVMPGSHRPDAASARPDHIARAVAEPTAAAGVLPVAVPAGTCTLYSSRLWHRGGANRSDRERTFCFLTVSEPDAPAPAGLIHTMEAEDVGAWRLDHRGLHENVS